MPDYLALWTSAKQYWKPVSEVGSVISSTGFIAYAIKEVSKRFQKPKLLCNITLTSASFSHLGDIVSDGRGGHLLQQNGTSQLKQECAFSIVNNSDFIAINFRIVNKDMANWDFPLDQTSVLKPYDRMNFNLSMQKVFNDADVIIGLENIILIDEIIIEYRNTSGRKYNLIFKPNEIEDAKRNQCVKA